MDLPQAGNGRLRTGIGLVVAVGLVHALVVAPRYHVGSFDDDSSYVLAARALATGHGLTSRLAGGYPLVGVYPPGYPALLSPLAAIWPSGIVAFRVLSLVLFVAVFPLTWVYLRRLRLPEPLCLAVLVLLALNPVLATYATMVMPEVAFVVVALLLLLAVDRWQQEPRTATWAGAASVLSATALPWLKEAGGGLVVGVVAWLLLRRLWRKAALSALVPALLLLPLVVMRALAGADLIGSRYAGDLVGVFRGGLVARIGHVAPAAVRTYVTEAVPRSLVPITNGLLPAGGPLAALLKLLIWTAAPLVGLGFVLWCRRHSDAACLAVPVYLAETLIYPFINERRVVLVLPFIAAWYAVGAASVFAAVRRVTARTGGRVLSGVGVGVPVVACLLALVALAGQFTRDYLYFEGADSSSPGGSPYMAILRQLGTSQEVVETDYLWTTALYSGHRTANRAVLAGCDRQSVVDAIKADDAGYLLTASLNGAGPVDAACLVPIVAALPKAVRLYRSARDQASVFELIGPGTGHPGTHDLLPEATLDGGGQPVGPVDEAARTPEARAGRYATVATSNGTAALTWSWEQPVAISQISLGAAGAVTSTTASVTVSVRAAGGTWREAASAAGAVGAGTRHPFFLFHPSPGDAITALRVEVAASGSGTVAVEDIHALGPSP